MMPDEYQFSLYQQAVIAGDAEAMALHEAHFREADEKLERSYTDPSATLIYAQFYARMGIAVFPVMHDDKRPFPGTRGFEDATTDGATIDKMFEWGKRINGRYPNIGAATGTQSGGSWQFDVIDVDGPAAVRALMDQGIFDAVRSSVVAWCSTQRDEAGHHLYVPAMQGRRNQTNVDGTGIDIRATGGYVVMPPSIGPTGRQWRWVHPPTFEAPTPVLP